LALQFCIVFPLPLGPYLHSLIPQPIITSAALKKSNVYFNFPQCNYKLSFVNRCLFSWVFIFQSWFK